MKRLLIFLSILTLIVGCQGKDITMSNKIIKYIDENTKQRSSCNIPIKEVTSFKWDKMVIFGLGSSNTEISKALGVKYNDSEI